MGQLIGSKLRKSVTSLHVVTCFLASMQSTSYEMPGWINHKLESRLLEEISRTSDNADNTTLMAESEDDLKSLLMRVKEESEKADLNSTLRKLR